MDATGSERPQREFRNWSGSLRFTPRRVDHPANEDELVDLVRWARREGRRIRVVGSRHSATGILEADDVLVMLDRMTGVLRHDATAGEAVVLPGTPLSELGAELLRHDLALVNYGDVATQTIAGAIGTGTHGTGDRMRELSQMLIGGRLVTGTGEIVEFSQEGDPELLPALRVALGSLGIFSELRLRLVRAFRIERREYCTTTEPTLRRLPELIEENRNFDFYWYPRSDQVKLRLLNPRGGGTRTVPEASLVVRHDGWAHEVIPKHSNLQPRFDEMEYALPREQGPACFLEVRERVRQRWRGTVGWRLLYRTEAASTNWLSPAYGRATAHVSLHQNAQLPHRAYFRDVEPILRSHGGRPHWAKKHTLRAPQLRALYPRWDDFLRVRERLDPDGLFLNGYLRGLFGVTG